MMTFHLIQSITLLFSLLTLLTVHNFSSTSCEAFSDASITRSFASHCPIKYEPRHQGEVVLPYANEVLGVKNHPQNLSMSTHKSRSLIIVGYSTRDDDERPRFYQESEKRGAYLLSLALLLCVWSFSIPVELRRDHWCFTSQCASNRSACYDCITFGEWFEKVRDYYANGGGIRFDFTVEEK